MSKLKNYTSTVPASTSMAKIEANLVEAGATDISKSYDGNKVCSAIRFRMVVNDQPLFFQLPANVDSCFNVLWDNVINKQRAKKQVYIDQAQRTAWKIVSDWVEIQLAMIQLEQAKPLQVFLPYVYDPTSNTTLYERMSSNMKLLTAGV